MEALERMISSKNKLTEDNGTEEDDIHEDTEPEDETIDCGSTDISFSNVRDPNKGISFLLELHLGLGGERKDI